MFQFDISGKLLIVEQLWNIYDMSVTLSKFQFDISGISFKEEQPKNKPLILCTFLVSKSDISGISFKEEHSQNINLIFVILSVFNAVRFRIFFNELQPLNIKLGFVIIFLIFNLIINSSSPLNLSRSKYEDKSYSLSLTLSTQFSLLFSTNLSPKILSFSSLLSILYSNIISS